MQHISEPHNVVRRLLSVLLALTIAFPAHVMANVSASSAASSSGDSDPLSPGQLEAQVAFAENWLKVELATQRGELSDRHPLDTFSLLSQNVFRSERVFASDYVVVGWPRVTAVLRSEDSAAPVHHVPLSPRREGVRSNVRCGTNENCALELWSTNRNGELKLKLNEFLRPIQLMAVIGPYLALVLQDSFSSDERRATLVLVDLARYQASLGNERIPMFEIPLHSDHAIESLRADPRGFVINEREVLSVEAMRTISGLFGSAFNFAANMVDPKTMAGGLTLYAAMDTLLQRTIQSLPNRETELEGDEEGLTHTLVQTAPLIENIRRELNRRVDTDARAAHFNRRTQLVDHAHLLDDRQRVAVEEYTKLLVKSGEIEKNINKTQERFRLGRRFFTRLKNWESYLDQPSRHPAMKIVQGLRSLGAYWANGAINIPSLVAKFAGRAPHGRKIQVGPTIAFLSSLVGSYFLARVLPDTYYQFVANGLSSGGQVAAYFGHVLYGFYDASFTSVKTIAVATNPMLSVDTYIDYQHGGYLKTMIGMSVFGASLAAGLGAWHVSRRLLDLVRDMKRRDYQGLIARQNRIEQDYVRELTAGERQLRPGVGAATLTPEEEAATLERLAKVKERHAEDVNNRWGNWIRRKVFGTANEAQNSIRDEIAEACENSGTPCAQDAAFLSDEARQVGDSTVAIVNATVLEAEQTPELTDPAAQKEIRTRADALKHLLFSTASYRFTVNENTGAFNLYSSFNFNMMGWFGIPFLEPKFERLTGQRLPMVILPRPLALATRFMFPNFFTTAVTKAEGKITMPTALNNGMTSLWSKYWAWAFRHVSQPIGNRPVPVEMKSTEPDPDYLVTPMAAQLVGGLAELDHRIFKKDLAVQEEVENKIIAMENAVFGEVTKQAMAEFATFIADDKELRRIFEVTNGFESVTSATIRTMSLRHKAFVRAYIDLLYRETMHRLLGDTLEKNRELAIDGVLRRAEREFGAHGDLMGRLRQLSSQAEIAPNDTPTYVRDADLKAYRDIVLRANQALDKPIEFTYTTEQVTNTVRELARDPKFRRDASAEATQVIPSLRNLKRFFIYEMATAYDPRQNQSMGRYDIVARARKDPIAMARATRNEIASLFRTMPLDIGLKFYFLAGVSEGLNKVVQNSFGGPNTIAYFSQNAIYAGLLLHILFRSVSSGWDKLGRDAQNAEEGLFGDLPEGEDAKYSAWGYFWKKWRSPQNSFWRNYQQHLSILFWTLPSAIPQIFLLDTLFKFRFDFEGLLSGYLLELILPLGALLFKFDQTYEQAALHSARGLFKQDLLHPKVQEWLQPVLQEGRNRFKMLMHFAMAPLHEIHNQIFVTGTALMDPYAIWRYMFNGFTPTEHIVFKLRATQEYFAKTPISGVVKAIAHGCEVYLTNGNTQFTKLPK